MGSETVGEDADLVLRSRSDPGRFAILFDRYFTALHNYAARRLGSAGADDVAAEAFLIAFRQRASFDPRRGSVRSWLYGIATNLIHEHRRDEERGYRAHSRAAAEPTFVEDVERADARIAAASARDCLVAALAGLSPEDRDTLLLVVWGELSHHETAAALGVPVGTVGSRLHRVRRQLRAALNDVNPVA
ncbi:RNA polymerase sigma factor [Dactylosporangium sp. NPDC048998]|uniref:RNA polymerase sigma factor n=1 Tax=Dactylosporangium sp. NPDC048998 TaxID=3363976 RepID=UPI003718D7A9